MSLYIIFYASGSVKEVVSDLQAYADHHFMEVEPADETHGTVRVKEYRTFEPGVAYAPLTRYTYQRISRPVDHYKKMKRQRP